ncbi:MAG: HYR domain-containing protein, partial [Phycisphaerae bacterium]
APTAFPIGDTLVTWTVTDASGTTATCQQKVTVIDDEPPEIMACPPDRMLTADANCQSRVPDLVVEAGVRDNCTNNPVLTQTPAAGAIIDLTGASIEIKATDSSGNVSRCTVLIAVNPNDCITLPDVLPPPGPGENPDDSMIADPEMPITSSDPEATSARDCGSGMCGQSGGLMMPLTLLWIRWMGRRRRARSNLRYHRTPRNHP